MGIEKPAHKTRVSLSGLDRNKTGLVSPSLTLFSPKDGALSQDTDNWLCLSTAGGKENVMLMSYFKRSKILYSLKIFFLSFHTVS